MDLMNLPQLDNFIPYGIILLNVFIFKLLRSFTNRITNYFSLRNEIRNVEREKRNPLINSSNKLKFFKLLIDELISTCELCADCFELNVVYERHGSLAYGLVLFLLTCLWLDTFGQAHTTPGYLVEDYFLFKGNQLFKTGDTYARFLGQSLAMPLAYRFASLYWSYKLLLEHRELLTIENCKSSLSTNALNGFLIEFSCCCICRLVELIGQKLLDEKYFSQKLFTIINSFVSTLLVVIALDLSGGYFNPVLASSMEYSCKGPNFYEHVLVFWFGPLIGHVIARHLFNKYSSFNAGKTKAHKSTLQQASKNRHSTASNATKTSTTQVIGNRRSSRTNNINNKKNN